MFDEVSEGTAYYKIAEDKADAPANAQLLYNDYDKGVEVPSDWWLQLAGRAAESLHSGTALPSDMPCCVGCKCPAPPDENLFEEAADDSNALVFV